jgi:hypothetical protein
MAAEPREIEGQVRYEEQERIILEAIQRRPIDIFVEESGCLEELKVTLQRHPIFAQTCFAIMHLAIGILHFSAANPERLNDFIDSKEESIRKAETQLEVERLGAMNNQGDTQEFDNFKAGLEAKKVEISRKNNEDNVRLKEKQLEETKRQNNIAEQLKRNELRLKEKQINKPKVNNN